MKSLIDGLGDQRVSMCADHNVGVRRVWPLGQPTSFFVILKQRGNHIAVFFRSGQSQQAVFGTKYIPNRKGGIGDSRMNRIVKGAVVVAVLGKQPGIEQCVI